VRKADVRQKRFPIFALAASLHDGAKKLLRLIVHGDIRQSGKITIKQSPAKFSLRNAQHPMRGVIGHQHATVLVRRENGNGAALNQDSQLLFGFATRVSLALNLMKVLKRDLAIVVHFANEQTGTNKCGKVEHIPGCAGAQIPGKIAETLPPARCTGLRLRRSRSVPHASNHHHGNQVEEAKRNLCDYAPIQQRNGRNRGCCSEQNRSSWSP
jgi:hypothetical protein